MGEVIELPRVKELEASIERLRQSVAEAICTSEYLVHVKGKEIEMLDRLAFCDVEIDILEARCRALVLARERERLLAGHTPAGKIVEAQMDEILARWQGELARKKALLAEARAWKAGPAAKDEELNALMISLIKALHPDLNPGAGDETLMEKAMAAFRAGDEKTLRHMEEEIGGKERESSSTGLLEEEKRLNHLLLGYTKEVTAIRERPPFAGAYDPETRDARRNELIKERRRAEKARDEEEAALQALLRNTKGSGRNEDEE